MCLHYAGREFKREWDDPFLKKFSQVMSGESKSILVRENVNTHMYQTGLALLWTPSMSEILNLRGPSRFVGVHFEGPISILRGFI